MSKPDDLAIGEWWKVPVVGNSHLSQVYASPNPGGVQASIIDAWAGAAYDTSRKELLICNGGHTDYAGNEIYAFNCDPLSANFLLWRIKCYYSAKTDGTFIEAYADATPSAAHSYNGMNYHAPSDKLYRLPGVYCWGSTGGVTDRTYRYDCTVESPSASSPSSWVRPGGASSDSKNGADPNLGNPTACSAYNATDGKFYSYNTKGLESFDTGTGAWTVKTNFEGGPLAPTNMTCCITDRNPQDFVNVGNSVGNCQVRRLDTFAFEGSGEAGFGATGATNIEGAIAPGILWDPVSQLVIGWSGLLTGGTDRRDWYTLNLATKVWTRNVGTGDIPDAPNSTGTYSRFIYIGAGLCVLVNSTTSDVYFLRVSGGVTITPIGYQLNYHR